MCVSVCIPVTWPICCWIQLAIKMKWNKCDVGHKQAFLSWLIGRACVCLSSCDSVRVCGRVWEKERERVIVGNKVTFQLLPGVWVRQRHGRITDSQLAFCSICFNLLCFPSLLIYLSFPHTFLSFFSCLLFLVFLSSLFYSVPSSSPLSIQFLCPTSRLPKRRIIYTGRGLFKLSIQHIFGVCVWERQCSYAGTAWDCSWQQW